MTVASYTIYKPGWIGWVDGKPVLSPALTFEAEWWDAWDLVWLAIGLAHGEQAQSSWAGAHDPELEP